MNTYEHRASSTNGAADFHVAVDGSDSWSGKHPQPNVAGSDGPFATLERAREAVRALKRAGFPRGGITVEIGGGIYERTAPFELTLEDSGVEGAPVVYRAAKGADVQVMGGRVIDHFTPVTDTAVLERLDPAARGKVVQCDLRAEGIDDIGEITAPEWAHGQPGLELFFRGERMTIARWPNEDFVKIASIDVEGNTPLVNRVTLSGRMRGSNEARFVYDGDRPKRWVGEKAGWLHGFWFWDWADQRQPIASIDPEKRVIELGGPRHGFGYREGQWYYAFNLLCELDTSGEWYLDRESGILYFWPPEPIRPGDATVSIAPVLVDMKQANYISFEGMTFENVRGTAITIEGGSGNLVAGCTIRNASSYGVRVDGGTAHGVVGCDIYGLGEGGVRMEGGDRVTLTSGCHYALNNHVHHCDRWNPLYHPGIALFGVGNRVAHNLIENLPHVAIGFTGNDQLIEYNEIHSCVYMANDAGAIYTSPPTEELTMYGHLIRHNYVHHLYGFRNRGCNGAVYLDDLFPGTTISGNIFVDVPRAAFVGGGRWCTIENNIFVDCSPAIHIDARGLGWAAGSRPELIRMLQEYPYMNEVWSRKYPTLVSILDGEPMAPEGNLVRRNVCLRGSWDEIEAKAKPYVSLEDNLVDVDPLFVDEGAGDYRLRPESPAFGIGFEAIPVEDIGLYEDRYRATRQVEHHVRPGGHEEVKEKTW